MFNKFKSMVTSMDLFGHPVNLKYSNHGHEFKTFIGGIVSFIIKGFVFWMIINMAIDMGTYNRNDTDSVPNMLTERQLMDQVKLEDMFMEFYFLIKSKDGISRPINTLKKYVTVRSG